MTELSSEARAARWWTAGMMSLLVLLIIGPMSFVDSSIPARSDLPGHLLPIVRLGESLFSSGQIRSWSFDWFAGIPLYTFYFPLPGLMAALLGMVVPDEVALRWVAFGPPLFLPWALALVTRWIGLGRWESAGVVAVGSTFLLMTSYRLLGGNLPSTFAGEFSYGWGLFFAVLYLGALSRPVRRRGRFEWLDGLLLAAATLCHVLPALAAGIGSLVALIDDRRARAIRSWWVAAGLTAFWVVPLAFHLDQVGHVGWDWTPGWDDILPLEVAFLLPAVILGLGRGCSWRGYAPLMAAALAGLILTVVPQSLMMRGRLLPLWFLAWHVAAGAGLGRALGQWHSTGIPKRAAVGMAGLLWALVIVTRGLVPLIEHGEGVTEGLSTRPGAGEFAELVEVMDSLPPGRVHWEDGDRLDRWGGPHAFALLPLTTPHSTLRGLWAESSPLTETVDVLNRLASAETASSPNREAASVDYSPGHALATLPLLGVRYFIAHSEETVEATRSWHAAIELASFGDLVLFDLGEPIQAVALECIATGTDPGGLRAEALDWVANTDEPRPRVVYGTLPGIGGEAASCTPLQPEDPAPPSVTVAGDRIVLATTHVGSPHLLTYSYFPDWTVEGGRGPWPATPWFMVVIPDQPTTTIAYRWSWEEWFGALISVCTLLGALQAWYRRRHMGTARLVT